MLFSFRYFFQLFVIFFLGLLLQFFLQTLFQHAFWLDLGLFWLWKEFLVFFLLVSSFFSFFFLKKQRIQTLLSDPVSLVFLFSSFVLLLFSWISSLVNNVSPFLWLTSLKYSFFPFLVFFSFYFPLRYQLFSFSSSPLSSKKTLSFVSSTLTICLLAGLVWYLMLATKPWTLRYVGYDPLSYEGVVWEAPPTVYRSDYNMGYARNQFLFERPIMWWFFLIAFFPLYFVLVLHKKSFRKRWFEWLLYFLNVFVTFSRAAWWSFLIELLFLFFLTRRGWFFSSFSSLKFVRFCQKKISWLSFFSSFLGKLVISVVFFSWGFVFLSTLLSSRFLQRDFSDRGHVEWVLVWLEMVWEKPLWWSWPWSAGPSSHQWELGEGEEERAFNPENQYLQIRIEYGFFWLLAWFWFYCFLLFLSFRCFVVLQKKSSRKGLLNEERQLLWSIFALWVGLIGLFIEWLVLHSFWDRMSLYPFLALFWLLVWLLSFHRRLSMLVYGEIFFWLPCSQRD